MNYERNCPNCNKILNYSSKQKLNLAIKNNSYCKQCAALKISNTKQKQFSKIKEQKQNTQYKRLCPICSKEILYKSEQYFKIAEKRNVKCKKCSALITKNSPEQKERLKKQMSGSNNNMYGKNLYDLWLEKYGEKIANEKIFNFKNKMSKVTSGENNPMYNKPAPKNSGRGWNGYYKNFHFRSLLELSYLKYLLDNNIKFESGEQSKYKIEYLIDNKPRNYFPDYYLIDTKEIIEIKPHHQINYDLNKIKFKFAKLKYKDNFKIVTDKDITKISEEEILFLYKNEDLIFNKKTMIKFLKKLNIKNKE